MTSLDFRSDDLSTSSRHLILRGFDTFSIVITSNQSHFRFAVLPNLIRHSIEIVVDEFSASFWQFSVFLQSRLVFPFVDREFGLVLTSPNKTKVNKSYFELKSKIAACHKRSSVLCLAFIPRTLNNS